MGNKSKLNAIYVILGLFLFKVGIVDHFRFSSNNSNSSNRIIAVADLTKLPIR